MTIIANGSNNQFSKYRKFSKYGAANNYGDGISGIRTDGSVTMLDIVSNCDTAVQFDGNSDRINIPASSDFNFGTGDFTVEWWQYLPSTPSEHLTLLSINYGTNPNFTIQGNGATSTAYAVYFNGISTKVLEGSSCPLNQWVHYAVVRNGSGSNNVKIYRDGVQTGQGTYTGNAGNSSSTNYIGGDATNSSVDFKGYVSNLRILKGTALYTSNFTPPTKQLTAVTNTKLLTCQGQNIKDASSSAHAITVNGDAKATIVSSAFEFDGTDDYVTTPSNTEVGFGTGDFTVESWFYSNGTQGSSSTIICLVDGSGGNDWQFQAVGAGGSKISVRNLFNASTDYTHNEWHHAAWTRQGSSNYLFLDGVQVGTVSDSTDYDYGSFKVGSNRISSAFFNGKISGVKIYKGKVLTAAEVQQNYNALKGRYV